MFGRTLWKGPRICSPAYDLKLRLTKCVIIRRGAPGSLVIAGGGGGGMLPRISSKLRLSTASAASPWDGSVAHREAQLFLFLCASRFRLGTVVHGGGVEEQKKPKQTNKTRAASYNSSQTTTPKKVDRRYFSLFWKQESIKKKRRVWPLMSKPTLLYKRSPREASIRETRCATFSSWISNN